MARTKYYTTILFAFMIAAIMIGCDSKAEKGKKVTGSTTEHLSDEIDQNQDEDAESYGVEGSGDRHKYSVSPGDHVLRFSIRLPYSDGYGDIEFRVQQSSLDALGITTEVENYDLESYFHPIWVVDAREGFMGLQKELFTRINDVWVVSLSDAEAAGRLSEEEILRRLGNKKYHYMNSKTKRMEISSEELSVYQDEGESYIAHVDVRVQIPAGEYEIHRQEAFIEGTPAGGFQITATRPDEDGPIFLEGPNNKNPNE